MIQWDGLPFGRLGRPDTEARLEGMCSLPYFLIR
jgi:hypothetical protein